MSGYGSKIDAVLEHALGFTVEEFKTLCLAAGDQAGLSKGDYADLRTMLNPVCRDCSCEIGNYEPTARDAKISSAEQLCEQCHTDAVRRVTRERRLSDYESRGDYMRDQRKDEQL